MVSLLLTTFCKELSLDKTLDTSASAPVAPFFSTVTGKEHPDKFDPQYWWSNIREPVLFSQAVSHMASTFVDLETR